MKIVLEIINGPLERHKIALRSSVRMTVGQSVRADFAIADDRLLSPMHFELQVDIDGAYVRDLHSNSGTLVNGNRMSTARLEDGDVLLAGETRFLIAIEEADVPYSHPQTSGTNELPQSEVSAWLEGTSVASLGYDLAFVDPEPTVVRAALEAAVWSRQPWVLNVCRGRCRLLQPSQLPFYELLAILGEAQDLPRLNAIAAEASLGPARWSLVGMFGHPDLLPLLTDAMLVSSDKETTSNEENSAAAVAAFAKIVGQNFQVDRSTVQADAIAYLQQHYARLQQASRWSYGFNVDAMKCVEELEMLDLESRWETAMRGHFRGDFEFSPPQLMKFQSL